MLSDLTTTSARESLMQSGGDPFRQSPFCPAFRKGKLNELACMECLQGGRINFRDFCKHEPI